MSKYINDLQVSVNHGEENEFCKSGYSQIPHDLNTGTTGKKIFLWFKTGTKDAITRIQFSFTEAMTKGLSDVGYTKLQENLNEGAGGNSIYLWYFRGSSEYDFPIVDLCVTTDVKDQAVKYQAGWERLACDLNRNAGGNQIHLWVKREKKVCISDIIVTDDYEGDSGNLFNGFIRVDEHTDKSGGNKVFIWYRLTTDESQALRDLQISSNESEYQNLESQGYSIVDTSLNSSIYLFYKKDGPRSPIRAVSIIFNSKVVELFETVGIHVIKKRLNTSCCTEAEYVCYTQ